MRTYDQWKTTNPDDQWLGPEDDSDRWEYETQQERKMPLNLSAGDGDFMPFMKYNAKAGRFYIRPDGATEEVEIVNPTLAFDMANIRTGWLYYQEGQGPEKIWDPSPTQMAAKPNGPRKFKRGFEVMVYGNATIPGTTQKIALREFSSTAATVIGAMINMHAAYEAGIAANKGKVPIFSCSRVKPVTSAYGTNYEPLFELRGWIERNRIPEFDELVREPVVPDESFDENPAPPIKKYDPSKITTGPLKAIEDDIPF